ncbi:alpha/beta hydrolase [Pseudocolwellia sp. HL-MZ7]|uniref:alpha/beta hydrolase n=2 Tax=unclassified Pseudocolwellia TaxID=2848178 RepID=UPI003CF2AA5D
MRTTLPVLLLFISAFTANFVWANDEVANIENCHLDGIRSQVTCGTLLVPENYQKPEGKKISINFAVLPAIDNSQDKEALMFLAGGPGQAAVELAAHIINGFAEIRKTRDIILVDQRGTGLSQPMLCDEEKTDQFYSVIPEDYAEQDVIDCVEQFKESHELSQYNSENAIRDFDAVRKALGHKQVHLYGASYGTRAALVYMRLFPDSIKSVVLDSVGPIEIPIGLFGASSARSFNLLLEHCLNDESCNKAYPNLREEFDTVVKRLSKNTVSLAINHPRLGTKTDFNLSHLKFINNIFKQLYSMETRSLVPLIIHQAFLENYQPLIGLIATSDGGMNMYVGLTFNIVCNEDIPRVTQSMLTQDSDNDFGRGSTQTVYQSACKVWPKYEVESAFYQPVVANIPTLILSGDLDPVTPPSNGEISAGTLTNSHHIISKSNAHIVASTPCSVGMVNEFLGHLNPKDVDSSCLAELPSESFMTSLNGSI